MIVYRFAHPRYAGDLSGTGAKTVGGRWNPMGVPVTYTSGHISLCLLEMLAHVITLQQLKILQLMEISIPDHASVQEVKLAALKKNWYLDFEYTQWMGQEILKSSKALLIKCPSAIIHSEYNYLINPLHPDFKKIKVKPEESFYFDERIFSPLRSIV